MLVVATAGHVDHGKSTLLRALTGMEPDRLDEERARGLTIELGYVWTTLEPPSGPAVTVAFVDVPGHRRFVGTTLAGLGPASTVLLVVAADGGWSAQTTEHVAAVLALGIRPGVVAITRCDLADPGRSSTEVADRLAGTPWSTAPVVPVSARTGAGLDELRAALCTLADGPAEGSEASAAPDLWVDRVFTIRGSGTVVTGTLTQGAVRPGDPLVVQTPGGPRQVVARGLHSLGQERDEVAGPARVAVNLRGLPRDALSPGARIGTHLELVTSADVARMPLPDATLPDSPVAVGAAEHGLHLHVGTAHRPVTVRRLGAAHLRLSWEEPLPLAAHDRGLLRDPAAGRIVEGVEVLSPAPPRLLRRGDAARRGAELAGEPTVGRMDGWLVDVEQAERWGEQLAASVGSGAALNLELARRTLGAPSEGVVREVAERRGLPVVGRWVGAAPPWAGAVARLRAGFDAAPFAAPSTADLVASGLGPADLREAAADGQLLVLPGGVVVAPDAVDRAGAVLAGLPAPFTTSQARQALGTSRRVAIPMLEHLDRLGITARQGSDLRVLVGAAHGARG